MASSELRRWAAFVPHRCTRGAPLDVRSSPVRSVDRTSAAPRRRHRAAVSVRRSVGEYLNLGTRLVGHRNRDEILRQTYPTPRPCSTRVQIGTTMRVLRIFRRQSVQVIANKPQNARSAFPTPTSVLSNLVVDPRESP